MSSGAGGGYRKRPLSRSISGLGKRVVVEATDGGDPGGLGRLPLVEVLTTHISSVDDLVAVAHGAKHLHTHGGLHHGRKAAGHGAELEPDIRDILALSKAEGCCIEAQRVVVGGQQVAGQSPVIAQIGLEGDLVIKPRIVGTGGHADCACGIGRNTVMPEETVQRNIGGVADTGEVIAHDLSGLYLAVAGLLNGHAEIGGLVVGGEFDDLVWILDLGLHLLTAELIVLGCGHLRNKVAAQRQRIGSGDAACIGHNIAHDLTGTGLRDLKHRAFQSRAGALASDEVIVSTILADLDLTGYSAVLPFDLRALTRLNIDGFVLLIADVALDRLQFTDIVLAGSQLVINVDVAILIRRILANGILACIVQDELDTIDTLAGSAVSTTQPYGVPAIPRTSTMI